MNLHLGNLQCGGALNQYQHGDDDLQDLKSLLCKAPPKGFTAESVSGTNPPYVAIPVQKDAYQLSCEGVQRQYTTPTNDPRWYFEHCNWTLANVTITSAEYYFLNGYS